MFLEFLAIQFRPKSLRVAPSTGTNPTLSASLRVRVVGVALLLLDGITFLDPVDPKVVRQDQDAQARETHLSQRFECRPEVWTVIKWAAAATVIANAIAGHDRVLPGRHIL